MRPHPYTATTVRGLFNSLDDLCFGCGESDDRGNHDADAIPVSYTEAFAFNDFLFDHDGSYAL